MRGVSQESPGVPLLAEHLHVNLSNDGCPKPNGKTEMTDDSGVFSYETIEDILIVTPTRDLASCRDSDMRDAYNEAYRLVVTGSTCHLVFDFSNLSYFGSTFVGIMVRLAKKVRSANGETVLCHLSDEIQGILKQLMLLENPKIDFFWKQMETRETTVTWLQSHAPREEH
jgi:anti-anti-sigma factor